MRLLKTKIIALVLLTSSISFAQLPSRVLVGYWENWGNLRLKNVDDRYNVLCLAFLEADKTYPATPHDNKVSDLEFTPTNKTTLKSDIITVQSEGKKVLISIGGGNGSFKLNNNNDKITFVSKVKDFIIEYGVDGIDIDLEQPTYICTSGNQSLNDPENHIQYLIDACKELLSWYKNTYGKKMILTTAPEVKYTIGGTSPWNKCNGALLPFIEGLKDDIDLLMIQLYNSGDIYSKDGSSTGITYKQSTKDFVIVAIESAIEGFKLPNQLKTSGTYSGLPSNKIVVGLTTCASDEAVKSKSEIISIMNYLIGSGPKAGSYTLDNSYPNLRGMMTWSINTDARMSSANSCNPSVAYEFAQAFEDVFGTIDNSIEVLNTKSLEIYPNPTTGILTVNTGNLTGEKITLIDINGKVVFTFKPTGKITRIDLSKYSKGIYTLKYENHLTKVIVK
tara:strand:+ start:25752 stop:27095 length:1344 start_codon:yes stop_codon:yes gene_type:complete